MIEETFASAEQSAAKILIDLALAEDLSSTGDLTCKALIPPDQQARVQVASRKAGILSGAPIGRMVFATLDPAVRWESYRHDGDTVAPGTIIAEVSGPLRTLLVGERTMLNFMTHLSGILLDNMPVDMLQTAVKLRDQTAPKVLLEASGGVNLDTVRGIARTGVERISVGALTHSAPALDLGFDWPC